MLQQSRILISFYYSFQSKQQLNLQIYKVKVQKHKAALFLLHLITFGLTFVKGRKNKPCPFAKKEDLPRPKQNYPTIYP